MKPHITWLQSLSHCYREFQLSHCALLPHDTMLSHTFDEGNYYFQCSSLICSGKLWGTFCSMMLHTGACCKWLSCSCQHSTALSDILYLGSVVVLFWGFVICLGWGYCVCVCCWFFVWLWYVCFEFVALLWFWRGDISKEYFQAETWVEFSLAKPNCPVRFEIPLLCLFRTELPDSKKY